MSNENNTNESKLYELGYHVVSTVSEDKVSDEVSQIKDILAANGAEIIREGEPKLINLAYEIVKHIAGDNQKFKQTYFGWVKFNADSESIIAIKEAVDQNGNILRSLIVKTTDDDEHSTSKIENTETDEDVELDEEDGVDKGSDDVEETEEVSDEEKTTDSETDDAENADEVDEAIDGLVK
jgi:ribosomal protein S6